MTDEQFWEEFPQKAEAALKLWNAPSVSIGVMKDGKTVFCGGFGKRSIEKSLPADGRTIYMIGSCSKAFTAALCAIFADRGIVDLDTPVRRYVPEIELKDPLANRECTLRDLLCHRTGLPRHEYSWYNTSFTREDMVRNMRYFEPSQPFRMTFQYCNYGYVLAGYILERLSGKSWEQLLQQEIFDPLGMSDSTYYIEAAENSPDHAEPYGPQPGGDSFSGMHRIPYFRAIPESMEKGIGSPIGPAGSIQSSAEDMLKFTEMLLNKGKAGERQIISESMAAELIKGQMLRDKPLDMPNPETEMMAYGLGWFVECFRGKKFVQHGGNIDGFSGFTSLMPELGLSVVAYTNMNGSFVHFALARTIYDHYLGVEDGDWVQRYYDFISEGDKSLPELLEHFTGKQVTGTSMSHALADYCGTYHKDGYSDMVISEENSTLTMNFIGVSNSLKHFHYDTFTTSDTVGDLPVGMPVHFHTAEVGGSIDALRMPLVTEAGGELVCFRKI